MAGHYPVSQEIVKQFVPVGDEVIDFQLTEDGEIGFAIEAAIDASASVAPVYFPIGPFMFGHYSLLLSMGNRTLFPADE
jgi:hypothetical protein